MKNNIGAYSMPYLKSKEKKKRDWNRIIFQVILLLPAMAFLIIFMYYPIEETFRLSLMRATGLGDTVFIGLKNYTRLFASEELRGLFGVCYSRSL